MLKYAFYAFLRTRAAPSSHPLNLDQYPLILYIGNFLLKRPIRRRFNQRKGFMSLSNTLSDPREICLALNERTPVGGLFEGDRTHLHPNSNLPWRISQTPFG